MEPTQLKSPARRGTPETSLVVESSRTPTLMAGEVAGGQGEVKVWISTFVRYPKNVRILTLFGVALTAWVIGFPWFMNLVFGYPPNAGCVPLIGLYWFLWWWAVKRPAYVTTDEAGIALTVWGGSRAVRWDQIHAVEHVFSIYGPCLRIDLDGGDSLKLRVLVGQLPRI